MSSPIAIADIFPPPTLDDVRTLELAFIAIDSNPVTDWHPGAILRTMFELESFVIQDLVANTLPVVFANGYPDAGGDSQTVVAHGWYNLDRIVAGIAIQTITLACDSAHGPYPIVAGRLYLATDGSRYTGNSGGTLNTSSTLTFDVTAESPGAARGLVAALVDKLAGVTVQSAAIKIISGVGQFGNDAESDPALLARTSARFPDLDAAYDPETLDRIVVWALAAGTTTTRTRLDPDTVNAGGVILTLATPSGGVSGGEVTTVQAYINARSFDLITAQAATNLTVNAAGVVTYPAAWNATILAAKQAAADAAWDGALSANAIGGKVELLTLLQSVMDQGAIDFTGLELNGSPTDLTMAATKVPVAGGSLASQLTWNAF